MLACARLLPHLANNMSAPCASTLSLSARVATTACSARTDARRVDDSRDPGRVCACAHREAEGRGPAVACACAHRAPPAKLEIMGSEREKCCGSRMAPESRTHFSARFQRKAREIRFLYFRSESYGFPQRGIFDMFGCPRKGLPGVREKTIFLQSGLTGPKTGNGGTPLPRQCVPVRQGGLKPAPRVRGRIRVRTSQYPPRARPRIPRVGATCRLSRLQC